MNRVLSSLYGGSLEITLTVPFEQYTGVKNEQILEGQEKESDLL